MAAQLSTAQSNVAVLKELYSDDAWVTKNYLYNNNPGLALIPKEEAQNGSLMGGKYFPVPAIVFGPAGGGSASFSSARPTRQPRLPKNSWLPELTTISCSLSAETSFVPPTAKWQPLCLLKS